MQIDEKEFYRGVGSVVLQKEAVFDWAKDAINGIKQRTNNSIDSGMQFLGKKFGTPFLRGASEQVIEEAPGKLLDGVMNKAKGFLSEHPIMSGLGAAGIGLGGGLLLSKLFGGGGNKGQMAPQPDYQYLQAPKPQATRFSFKAPSIGGNSSQIS